MFTFNDKDVLMSSQINLEQFSHLILVLYSVANFKQVIVLRKIISEQNLSKQDLPFKFVTTKIRAITRLTEYGIRIGGM